MGHRATRLHGKRGHGGVDHHVHGFGKSVALAYRRDVQAEVGVTERAPDDERVVGGTVSEPRVEQLAVLIVVARPEQLHPVQQRLGGIELAELDPIVLAGRAHVLQSAQTAAHVRRVE